MGSGLEDYADVRMGFAEPLAAYAASVVIPNACESAVAELERSRKQRGSRANRMCEVKSN